VESANLFAPQATLDGKKSREVNLKNQRMGRRKESFLELNSESPSFWKPPQI
jgi:hypothetical protein